MIRRITTIRAIALLTALCALQGTPQAAIADDAAGATDANPALAAHPSLPSDATPSRADRLATPVAVGGTGNELRSATLRMTAGLAAVLALLGGVAWLSRRFRVTPGMRGGPIEVLSGISLGTREKVVLLRVGREQVLVGVSAAGMRTLHVLDARHAADFATVLKQEPA